VTPRTALAPPSAEAKKMLSCKTIDINSGEIERGSRGLTECFRIDARGRIVDTQSRLLSAQRDDNERPRRRRAERTEASGQIYYRDWSWGQYGGWQQWDNSYRQREQRRDYWGWGGWR
jgi:hypothetical protein